MALTNEDLARVQWVKASASHPAHMCVEVSSCPVGVAVRDSKAPEGAVLRFSREEFAAFLDGAKKGEFDHFAAGPVPVQRGAAAAT